MDPIFLVGLVSAVLGFGIFRLLEEVTRLMLRKGKSLVVWDNPETREATIKWEKIDQKGELTKSVGPDVKATWIAQGARVNRSSGNLAGGNVYILDPDPTYGRSYVPPTRKEVIAQGGLGALKLLAYGPEVYQVKATVNNQSAALKARLNQDSVWVKLAPFLLIGLVLLIGMMGFGLYMLTKLVKAVPVGPAGA